MSTASPLVEAQQKFINAVPFRILAGENCEISQALGRTLARDVIAPEDAPAYNRAIVEGFVVHSADTQGASEDTPKKFTIVGRVRPGDETCPAFGPGEAVEVETGSLVPDGPVAIVRMWEARRDGDGFTTSRPFPPRFFIEDRACDIARGSVVAAAGTVLTPTHIGTLASLGIAHVPVARAPRVTLFSSGNEVIPHTASFTPGLIRDCNQPMLSAAIQAAGGMTRFGGIMRDDFDAFVTAVRQALTDSDIIVISGGTAIGGRDFISDLVRAVGELIVDGVPMKSGRPLIMGIASGRPIVCVAGHPPEALRGFRLFGAPAIERLLGQDTPLPSDAS